MPAKYSLGWRSSQVERREGDVDPLAWTCQEDVQTLARVVRWIGEQRCVERSIRRTTAPGHERLITLCVDEGEREKREMKTTVNEKVY